MRKPNAKYRTREYLTEREVEGLIAAAKDNRWGHRDATMILLALGTVYGCQNWLICAGSR
jgi:integrase